MPYFTRRKPYSGVPGFAGPAQYLTARNFYTVGTPTLDPANVHIGKNYAEIEIYIPDTVWPDLAWTDFYIPVLETLTTDADAGTGFRIGWGVGDPAWDTTPVAPDYPPDPLVSLLGEHKATWDFVVVDSMGVIDVEGTKFTISGTTTDRIYLEAPYTTANEPEVKIRELGAYLNPVATSPATNADPYIVTANFSDLGDLITVGRITAVQRTHSTSGKVKMILKAVV